MKRHGYISDKEYNLAKKMTVDKLLKQTTGDANKYQAFLDTVIEDVQDKTGQNPYNVAMKIYTTMDPDKQQYIDNVMNGKTFTWENDKVNAGISVIDVKTGAIVAVGAGRNRTGERSFNTATMIKSQIGSTAKPLYDYAMGIEKKGWSTYEPFADEPHSYSGTGDNIDNWNRTFQGWMTLRGAITESRNIPALKAFQANSKKDIKTFVESVGLSPEYENGVLHEAHALGGYNGESPLTLSAAYASFASGGYYTKPYSFTKIIYRNNNKAFETEIKRNKVLSPETSYMMSDVLYSAATWGIGTNSTNNGAKFGAKTGTSNFDEQVFKNYDFPNNAVNDLWVAGISPDYSISVWYGYDKINKDYVSTSNTSGHRRLFLKVANGIFKTGSTFTRPAGVSDVTVENYTYPAKLPSANTPADLKITELFKKGTEPTEVSKRFDTLDSVKNPKSSLAGNTVTLTWDKVNPAAFDTSWVSRVFSDSGYANNFIGTLNNYNASRVGTFGYNVYTKNSNGTLSLIDFVTTNKISFTVKSSDTGSYVIKSS
ncbi:MAG: transglycosylase domain-containing protein, partial [Vagococcus sp.]